LFSRIGVDGVIARLVDTLVKLIGVEKLALVLAGVRIIASFENRSESSRRTSTNGDVDA